MTTNTIPFIIVVFSLNVVLSNQASLAFFVNRADFTCPEYKNKNLPLQLTEFKMHPNKDGKVVYIQYTVNVISELHLRNAIAHIELERCANREAPDTCENFARLNLKAPCRVINVNTEFYSPVIHCLRPKVACPIKPAIYRGINCTLNMDLYNLYPFLLGYYWNTKLLAMDTLKKEPIACMMFQGYARRIN